MNVPEQIPASEGAVEEGAQRDRRRYATAKGTGRRGAIE